jgi:3D (Asp-Asp-Asp) domain-containing protein
MRMKSNKVFLIFVAMMVIVQVIATVLMVRISSQKQEISPTITPSPTSSPIPTPVPTEIQAVIDNTKQYVVSRGGEEYCIETFKGKITMYTAGEESCGKKPNDPLYGITASGKHVKSNHTIAMDKKYPFGTLVVIEGFEGIIFEVEDRGGGITDNDVDVYIEGLDDALDWGVRFREVKILKLGGE